MSTEKVKQRKLRVPKYRLHKATGQAAVTINGKHLYLGEYDSPKSHERYHQEIAKWVANQGVAKPELDPAAKFLGINNVIEAYLAFAEKYYQNPSGKKSSEVACLAAACEPLIDLYGTENAREFGPMKLKLVREHMIAKRWSRNTINKAIDRIKRMFRWATEEELLSPDIYHGLQSVAGLKFGRTSAKESQPIAPVSFPPSIIPYCGGLARFGEFQMETRSALIQNRRRRSTPFEQLREALSEERYKDCELMHGFAMCPHGHWMPHAWLTRADGTVFETGGTQFPFLGSESTVRFD